MPKRNLKGLTSDAFCKYVVDLILAMRSYRYTDSDTHNYKENNRTYGKYITITGNYNFQKLKDDVDNNKCNPFTIKYASEFFQEIYEFYKSRLSEKVRSFNNTVEKEIEKYELQQKFFNIINNVIKSTILTGTILISIFLLFDLFPRPILFIISAFVAFVAALDKVFNFSDKNLNLFLIVNGMREQYNLHNSSLEPYNLRTGAALDLFMRNIIQYRRKKNELASIYEKSSQEQIQKLEKESNSLQKKHVD